MSETNIENQIGSNKSLEEILQEAEQEYDSESANESSNISLSSNIPDNYDGYDSIWYYTCLFVLEIKM